jgi:hypothetical protein
MGLGLATHFLADQLVHDPEGADWARKQVALINAWLSDEGLPAHDEPEKLGTLRKRRHVGGFPYSFLHYLRRAYARHQRGLPPLPLKKGENPLGDGTVADVASMMASHLLCHSDAEGFYVPIEFPEPLFDVAERGVPGGMLGSSQALMRELVEVAPAIGITLDGDNLSDAEAARIAEESDVAPWRIERLVWLALYENTRVSIAEKTLLVFC